MKKLFFLILMLNASLTFAQFITIAPTGGYDDCFTNNLTVVNPLPGYNFQWYVGSYGCSMGGTPMPFGFGHVIPIYGTGEYYCIGTDANGLQYISNPIIIRVLPGSLGSMFMPAPIVTSNGSTCVTSAALCIPYVFHQGFSNTIIKWYRDNVLIPGTGTTLTATVSGNYKYTITNLCTISESAETTISMIPQPQITSNVPGLICPNDPIIYNVVAPAPLINYTWQQLINANYVNVGTGYTFSTIAPTNGNLVMRLKAVDNNCTAYSNILTNPLVNVLAIVNNSGSASFCTGDSVLLNASNSVGITFQWYKGNIPISGATSPLYYAKSAGTYKVIVASPPCSSTSPNISLTENSLPTSTITVNGLSTFCYGDSTQLSANAGVGFAYQWRKNGVNIPGATSKNLVVKTTGNYRVIVTNANGCKATSATKTITVKPLPTATITALGPLSFCNGDSVKLVANSLVGATYKWKKYSNFIANATSINYTAKTSGVYKAQITDINGCSKVSNTLTVNVNCREQNDLAAQSNILIEPNPFNENTTITWPGYFGKNIDIKIYNTTGSLMKDESIKQTDNSAKITIKPAGLYFVVITTANEAIVKRIMKVD